HPGRAPRLVRAELAAQLHRCDHDTDAGGARQPGLPGTGQRGAAAVVGPGQPLRRRTGPVAAPVSAVHQREPLDTVTGQGPGLVRHRAQLRRPAPRPGRRSLTSPRGALHDRSCEVLLSRSWPMVLTRSWSPLTRPTPLTGRPPTPLGWPAANMPG